LRGAAAFSSPRRGNYSGVESAALSAPIVFLLFFLSGAAALVYQTAWQRILALGSGVGIYSVAMIVGAFMAGLGIGSHAAGVRSARISPRRALQLFALVELGIGLFGLLTPGALLANFTNPGGLEKVQANMYQESGNSGAPDIGTAGTNGRGQVGSGVRKGSNTDLAREFTNVVVAQRGFQASSRIIATADEMLQDLVNLKR
jgi:hypothetical protein